MSSYDYSSTNYGKPAAASSSSSSSQQEHKQQQHHALPARDNRSNLNGSLGHSLSASLSQNLSHSFLPQGQQLGSFAAPSQADPPKESAQKRLMMLLRSSEMEPPMYSYTSTGPVNWKALWNALLSGQQNSLRKWVVELPIKGCKVDQSGQLDVGGSVLPPTFALQLNEMLDKAVPPLADLVIDSLCWRGIFLPSELANFDLLSIRLARNLLLLRPAGKRENKPLSLERFIPFAAMAPFHRYMLTRRLKKDVYQHQSLRKAYVTWYKLKEFLPQLDAAPQKKLLSPSSSGSGNDRGLSSSLVPLKKRKPILFDIGNAPIDSMLGTFVPGHGYVVGLDEKTGQPRFGDEEEGVSAMRAAQEEAGAKLKAEIDVEIEDVQLLAADALVKPNFDFEWLKLLGIPGMRVHPVHIHHDEVSAKLNDEIDAMLPRGNGRRGMGLLQNSPSEQILMLILFLVYKNTATRAMRISIPLLSSNPVLFYKYLSVLVCKVAIASSSVGSRANKRNQANCMAYLKMLQQYADVMLPGNTPDGLKTVHGLPATQNYTLVLSLLLDFSSLIQRYMTVEEILNTPTLSSLLPVEHIPSYERLHLPTLMWYVFDAIMRRRASLLESMHQYSRVHRESDQEREQDAKMIAWVLALGMKLYKVIVAGQQKAATSSHTLGSAASSDSSTLLYILLGLHMMVHESFPAGFGVALRKEQAGCGPTALWTRLFLWFAGMSQEEPMMLIRRVLQLHDEEFFTGEVAPGYHTSLTDARATEEHLGSSQNLLEKMPLTGTTCLEHLCLVLAPHSAILLAAKQSFGDTTAEDDEEDGVAVGKGVNLTIRQRAEAVANAKPVFDPTSQALLRIAYDPYTQSVLNMSNPAKASYLLSKSMQDEAMLALACGIGASSADCLLFWLKKTQEHLLTGIPELPQPGPSPPVFGERTLPLEKALLRLTRAGCWYTLMNGFSLFAPKNILFSIVQFLKYFTQRRYRQCHAALTEAFVHLSESRKLVQPNFGKRHFFAVAAVGNNSSSASRDDVRERNTQSFLWTQKLVVQMLRSGLLIGMQGNIPSSHRIANAKDNRLAGSSKTNAQGYTAIDLTDYDRNFLMDLFAGMLNRFGPTAEDQAPEETHDTSTDGGSLPAFHMAMMNEILSVIPPTVSSSFLLNITSIQGGSAGGGFASSAGGSVSKTHQSHRDQHRLHQHTQWKARLTQWKENEAYYARKVNEVTSLLDLEQMVGVSLDERERFIKYLYRDMDELDVTPAIRAALWYQICMYFYRQPHTMPDSLQPKASNSCAEAAHLTQHGVGAGAVGAQPNASTAFLANPAASSTTAQTSAAAIAAALRAGAPLGSEAASDPELQGGVTYEHASERSECEQELVLLYLALTNWQRCHTEVDNELESYFHTNPAGRPQPKLLQTTPDGKQVFSKTETTPALTPEGRPVDLPQEVQNKLTSRSQFAFLITRLRGRIFFLMGLHGLGDLRFPAKSTLTYDLNSPSSRSAWMARAKEREQSRVAREEAKMLLRAEREAARMVAKAKRTRGAAAAAMVAMGGASAEEEKKTNDLPALPSGPNHDNAQEQSDEDDEDDDSSFRRRRQTEDAAFAERERELDRVDAEASEVEREEEYEDQLFPDLMIEFTEIFQHHVGTSTAGAGGSIAGLSFGLEKFHLLSPSQYLPWNGSATSNPSTAVADAQAKHRAISYAFDEDMDITKLSPAEIRLLGEHSIDTKLVLSCVESLLHTHQFRTALCVVSDLLDRFPSLRFTPRMQAALALCDVVQMLFWLAHPTLQDLRVNTVLAGAAGAPFAGTRTTLGMPEQYDPFARLYKELLAWPVLPHMLKEEDQTWMRMRWYGGVGQVSNQTLMLQRLLVDSPAGSVFQNLLLSLLLADESSGVSTVYSRTRPVGVEIKPAAGQEQEGQVEGDGDGEQDEGGDTATGEGSSSVHSTMRPQGTLRPQSGTIGGTMRPGKAGGTLKPQGSNTTSTLKPASSSASGLNSTLSKFGTSFFGTMKNLGGTLGNAIKGGGDAPKTTEGGPPEPLSLDVEHLRQWLVTLDEAARVELLDRFVVCAGHPSLIHTTGVQQPAGGLTGAVHASANSSSSAASGQHTLLKESFNAAFRALNLRHLPLLSEIAQYLAISVRITKVELTKARNKKLAAQSADPPGVRMTSLAFLTALSSILVKTRAVSKRFPSTHPMHYASKQRCLPDTNSPTHAWLLNLSENLGIPVLELLGMHTSQLITYLWHTPGGSERAAISTLFQSGQIYYHFISHPSFCELTREVGPADLSASLVETFLGILGEQDRLAGPPSPFANFQAGRWWTREEYVAFIGLADRTEKLALPTLAAALRAQAFVLIRARDPDSALSSSILADADTQASLLGWWQSGGKEGSSGGEQGGMLREGEKAAAHAPGGDFVRLTPGTMVEYELLHASYICYMAAGRTFEMRQVAADLRAGLTALLTSINVKSKTPAPPIITSPTNPDETIQPPFPGASLEQIEQTFLARLQLERCAVFLNNAETRDAIVHIWRAFKKRAPMTFA
jgi:hypothetical protein